MRVFFTLNLLDEVINCFNLQSKDDVIVQEALVSTYLNYKENNNLVNYFQGKKVVAGLNINNDTMIFTKDEENVLFLDEGSVIEMIF